ncbi:hypothetical protein [Avibacterium paragallinarum]|uniref:hypothetical protein n=1 Tax=Avibacterium paragallinarum TaxID=728 RepID=UPI00397AFCA0
MNFLVLLSLFLSCFLIGCRSGATGVFALFLCFISFVFGVCVMSDIVKQKAKDSELLKLNDKYYTVEYVKDKVK